MPNKFKTFFFAIASHYDIIKKFMQLLTEVFNLANEIAPYKQILNYN